MRHFEETFEKEDFDQGRQDQWKQLQEKVPWLTIIAICVTVGGVGGDGAQSGKAGRCGGINAGLALLLMLN